MRDKEFKKRDKRVHKMTRDGLVEQNRATGEPPASSSEPESPPPVYACGTKCAAGNKVQPAGEQRGQRQRNLHGRQGDGHREQHQGTGAAGVFTIETKAGNVFYIVVDKQKQNDNVYLLSETTKTELTALA